MTNKKILIDSGSLVLLSGLPGAGKSSLKRHALNFRDLDQAWISMDELRLRLLGAVSDVDARGVFSDVPQTANGPVFEIARLMARARLEHGRTCIVDGTWPNDLDRKSWADLATEMGRPFKVLIVDTSLDDCIEANKQRQFRVSEECIREIAQPTAAAPLVKKNGEVIAKTAPTGFVRSSNFPFELISRGDVLVQNMPFLAHEHYDVVGDIHGLMREFVALIEQAGWRVEGDRLTHPQGRKLLILGDLVDRGYDSLGLVRLIRRAVEDGVAECIPGNHESKLLRFYDAAKSVGVEKWGSYANAQTGMELLRAKDAEQLVAFLRALPSYKLLHTQDGYRLAFVHANLMRFDAELGACGDNIYGQTGFRRGVDTDAIYEERYHQGLNHWTLFRGHIPQTSEQEHVFSLERNPFEHGELVLLRLDEMLAKVRAGATQRDAFKGSILTQYCDYSFEEASKVFALSKGLDHLVNQKMATRQMDESKMLKVYKYSKQTFWDNRWGESEWLIKARGIVLDAGSNIVSHPFDKLFNFRENGVGLSTPDETAVISVDKLNGFLGICSAHPLRKGDLLPHTQGGFGGEFVERIREYLYVPRTRGLVSRFLSKNDVTLMFEVLHPDDPHIIGYPASMMGLHLIGVRGKGERDLAWTEESVDAAAAEMELRRPKWSRTSFGEVKARIRGDRGEGVMVRSDTPAQEHLFKWKTPYYLTTKFLGRLSAPRIAHMYGNPKDFKKTVDEEFYEIVDLIVATTDLDAFQAMDQDSRVLFVRSLIDSELMA